MVIDDDPLMGKLLKHQLLALGSGEVTLAAGGRAALHLLTTGPAPDAILLDLNMPEMDGLEFLRHLVGRDLRIGIGLISGEDERMLQAAGQLAQAHGLPVLGRLRKPVHPADLAALLEDWQPPAPEQRNGARVAFPAEALRGALERAELVNHYQPQVALADGRVTGVEALVRWQHPEAGLVYPDRFLAVAETAGLIGALTSQVLAAAFAQARQWREAGLELGMAVNVSMDNLATPAFVDCVEGLAAAAGVAPAGIVLEVTESRLMTDLRAPLETLTRLRLKRFRLSIDDFGTGNSSLVQLRDLPFDELKIDRGFVHRADREARLGAIFDANVALARQLGMQTVAEGVEDAADWTFARRRGCDLAQGYFIARPMPAAQLPAWVANWQARLPEQLA
ncbi:MAG: EAL domain-containing response regulator [Sulfuritalea sp.]|nr:EAL domain-containing response regulator [Sulfuritalea sp.]